MTECRNEDMQKINAEALCALKAARGLLSWQQYENLRAQVLAGDDKGAMEGMRAILSRWANDDRPKTDSQGNEEGIDHRKRNSRFSRQL